MASPARAVVEPVGDEGAELERLEQMLGRGAVEEARALVREMPDRWPDSPKVRQYARVLAPPEVRLGDRGSGRSRDLEHAWLREHAQEYPGCWIALLGDRMVAADPSVATVYAAMRDLPGGTEALLHFQPE
jgi:hypothetical protein